MELPIGVIDSGVGGASILKAMTYALPDEKFVYLADTKNSPYGNKKKQEINRLTLNLVDFLVQKRAIKMLVVGCNTMSAVSKQSILTQFPSLPCVFVEPPIKTAVDANKKNMLILATRATLNNNKTIKYYSKLAKKQDLKITKLFINDLAYKIDNEPFSVDELLKKKIKNRHFDAVVLGCTHYNFIKENLKKILPTAEIISCEKNIANRVKSLLLSSGQTSQKFYLRKKFNNVEIILTEYNKSVYSRIKSIFPGCISAHKEK